MKINKKTQIGINVVSRLKNSQEPLRATELAQSIGTTVGFLEQVMKNLKKAELVHSKHGPGGGYTFNKACDPVTAYDVASAMGQEFAPFISRASPSPEERINGEIIDAFIRTKI